VLPDVHGAGGVSDEPTIARLMLAWQRWSNEPDFPFTPDHCINGTRIAIGALKHHGVSVSPRSVQFAMFNRFAWDLFESGVPAKDFPPHAWSLGIGPGEKLKQRAEGWSGHLVAEGDGWTLDISAGQFNRPGLVTVDGPRFIPANVPDDEWLKLTDDRQQVLIISQWNENNAWRRAPGWKRDHAREIREVLRRMEQVDGIEVPS